MKKILSFEPDEHMQWIYDPSHKDYHSDEARDLRERRAHALASLPTWMLPGIYDDLSKLNKE